MTKNVNCASWSKCFCASFIFIQSHKIYFLFILSDLSPFFLENFSFFSSYIIIGKKTILGKRNQLTWCRLHFYCHIFMCTFLLRRAFVFNFYIGVHDVMRVGHFKISFNRLIKQRKLVVDVDVDIHAYCKRKKKNVRNVEKWHQQQRSMNPILIYEETCWIHFLTAA